MPEKRTLDKARRDKRQGKSASTQAGEFVREEIHHVREGKHGARSPEQAIAIGLSKARRAGVKLPPREKGESPKAARKKPSPRRSRAMRERLKKEGKSAASKSALSRHAKTSARRRTASERSAAARKAARTRARS
jgi:hypothetical protein